MRDLGERAARRRPSSASRRRITSLSCACSSASGPGCTVTPSATSARRCSCGTCSWSKVTAAQPRANARNAARSVGAPWPDVRGDLRRRVAAARGEHPQRLPERDRGLMRHAGQLPGADHADDGQPRPGSSCVHGAGSLPARPPRARSGTINGVSVVETVLGTIPQPYRDVAIRHRELVKFAIVGGTTWVIDTAVFLTLKTTRAGDRSRSPRRSSRCSSRRSCPTCSTASGPSAPAAAASATTRPCCSS